ncbi:MAG: T9SS type A sorting domain-containing protein [Candidatus Eisenbacteria bacterium]
MRLRVSFSVGITVLEVCLVASATAATLPVVGSCLTQGDLPGRTPLEGSRSDTVSFGYYTMIAGQAYAVVGETWTFDHDAPDPAEGWTAQSQSNGGDQPFRRIDAATWAGHGNNVPAPIIAGNGSAWLGKFDSEADASCYASGLGYGNHWCQTLASPVVQYGGTGSVDISFRYFTDSEEGFDYSHVKLVFDATHEIALSGPDGWSGQIGNPAVADYPTFTRIVNESELAGFSSFQVVFQFVSDGGYSDEDGHSDSQYGPLGVDEVVIGGSFVGGPLAYGFESDLDGWSTATCGVVPPNFGIAHISNYAILDPCGCKLSGYVMEFHDANFQHPNGQYEIAASSFVNRGALGPVYNSISAEFDMYAEMPQANGVFYRPGWYHYPYVCPQSGASIWSPREGRSTYQYIGIDPVCFHQRDEATSNGVPGDASLYRFAMEVASDCEAFGIPPTLCTGITNFTPIFDNLEVDVTHFAVAPIVRFETGGKFIDGWGQGLFNSTTSAGNADVEYDLHRDLPLPDLLGDSLTITGPIVTSSTRWEAKMWWRIRREGPGSASIVGYTPWKNAVADGRSIVGANGQFTYGWMDSMQALAQPPAKHRFISEFREDDDDFAGENTPNNEMIRDGILGPGTQIQYFITANYTCTPSELYYLPDTSGGNFEDFEILPSYRMDAGVARFPCLLFINAANSRYVIDHALNVVLNGAGPTDPIPNPTRWDRLDYGGCSCWNAPFARSTGGNNGATLAQLLEYRGIFLDLGTDGAYSAEEQDFQMLGDWVTSQFCPAGSERQGLIVTGEGLDVSSAVMLSFSHNVMGADPVCDNYSQGGCGPTPADDSRCVRIEDAAGGSYPSSLAGQGGSDYAYDAWGNFCPEGFPFSVLAPAAGGVGNRAYYDHDGTGVRTNYSQVTKSVTAANGANYRSVLDGVSWHHLSDRDPVEECVSDEVHMVTAAANELKAALSWIYNGALPGLCSGGCSSGFSDAESPDARSIAKLEILGVSPNPFRGVGSLRFALPSSGDTEITLLDVAGRRVATLWSGPRDAGIHTLPLDEIRLRNVASGLYWVELKSGGASAARKMIVLP